jgi:hypothetical protein
MSVGEKTGTILDRVTFYAEHMPHFDRWSRVYTRGKVEFVDGDGNVVAVDEPALFWEGLSVLATGFDGVCDRDTGAGFLDYVGETIEDCQEEQHREVGALLRALARDIRQRSEQPA